MPEMRFIVKLDVNASELPSNVLALDYLPQQELLAHPNTTIFITQGSVNAAMEAIVFR
jgi:UDP:flavonoid glycosyltransferase YjiC (YdhE family)